MYRTEIMEGKTMERFVGNFRNIREACRAITRDVNYIGLRKRAFRKIKPHKEGFLVDFGNKRFYGKITKNK